MLQINSLSKHYPGRRVFEQYSQLFTHPRSCLVGKNGTGKSTLLSIIAGLTPAQCGQIHWQGQRLSHPQQQVALASDSLAVPDFLTPRQLFTLNQQLWQLPWPAALIDDFALTPYLHNPLAALSAGNQKKCQLICALMRDVPLLLLDEPNLALDHTGTEALWQHIATFGGQIIAASNEPELFAEKGFTLVYLD